MGLLLLFLAGLSRPDGEAIGVGLDSCVLPTRHKGIFLVQTTDLYPYGLSCVCVCACVCVCVCVCMCACVCVCLLTSFQQQSNSFTHIPPSFYPLVEDPYMQVITHPWQ